MDSRRDPTRLAVLVSGTGPNIQALPHACTGPSYGMRVVAVGADRQGTPMIRAAEGAGVPTFVHVLSEHSSREEWDKSLYDAVAAYKSDIVVLTSPLKLVGPEFLAAFPQRMMNTHNMLLPSSPGIHGPADVLAYGMKVTGTTLLVVDPGMDTGPILGQTTCLVLEGDSEEALVKRIKGVECAQLVELIGRMTRGGWWVDGKGAGVGARSR